MTTDPTGRFSSRVEDYIRYRPGYPPEIIRTLGDECGLTERTVVADIGSGTGILTELFLKNGNSVFGVEPNREMREAGERLLSRFPQFRSIPGRAEATGLKDGSVGLVAAGQAFHWFDRAAARSEFLRILGRERQVILIWNERQTLSTPFLRAYEDLLNRFGTDYAQVDHRRIDGTAVQHFFGGSDCRMKTFPHVQRVDLAGARGRLLSSSYVPGSGDPGYEEMLAELGRIYERHQRGGSVEFEYDAIMYYGRLQE